MRDAPSLIERVFPSMKISAESQKERKGVHGQTLTSLGSYWKGRKPLVLVRACVLGCLLPATENPETDLEIFEALMAIDDAAFEQRVKRKSDYPAILELPYEDRLQLAVRPEELPQTSMMKVWARVNAHVGTSARSLAELVEQLGVMRFGRRPKVADTFSGGGSIPFEAARTGCDVIASDLNPVACMLTWGALNLAGKADAIKRELATAQSAIAAHVDAELSALGLEHDSKGNKAKVFLYCLETRCPETGWLVPMLPSRVLSDTRRVVVELIPVHAEKRYDIMVRNGVSADEHKEAAKGTLVAGRLVHPINPNVLGVAISTIRGDTRNTDGSQRNALRRWGPTDVAPRPDDIFQERLYAIQWITRETVGKSRNETFFAAASSEDLDREQKAREIVEASIVQWQDEGLVSSMAIETGQENEGPIRTNGWCYWHQLFMPRAILTAKLIMESPSSVFRQFVLAKYLDNNSKSCRWAVAQSGGDGGAKSTFDNQALKTMFTWANRSFSVVPWEIKLKPGTIPEVDTELQARPAAAMASEADLIITDPPYADAVRYEEITEFFIAWLRMAPPKEFANWTWDSRRKLAIKGKDEDFRTGMVDAYRAMTLRMPDNGVQIVMFTHQDGKVWSDMAQIFWGAGLQVMADWYIATETTSELKKGGYVQGTHIIVLRKRSGDDSGYSDEITQEVKEEVARQIEEMVGLNQSLRGHGRSENLFNDADLQMAGYAAALRVLTKYVKIDGKDMTVEALRPRAKNERTVIDDIIEYAVQVANEHLVPEGMTEQTWRKLTGTERFYLKMMDIETTGSKKVDNYQNFAKAFRVADYGALMSSVAANSASLKSAADFGKRQMGEDEFGSSMTRVILYALWEMKNGVGDDEVLGHLRDLSPDYLNQRGDLQAIADYISAKRKQIDVTDSQNATILTGLIKNERLG